MKIMLFLVGAAMGSFINVLSLRYDPDRFLFGRHVLGGRSRCPSCRRTLRWFELVPIVSFLVQRGKCRTCKTKISLQYPLVEFASGLIFVFVAAKVSGFGFGVSSVAPLAAALWIAVFVLLLLLSLIDLRLHLIPDEINVLLALLGIALAVLSAKDFGLVQGSFLGPSAAIFGLRGTIFINRISAAMIGGAFFGALVLLTRGRGMGMGDVKLAAALGIVFGWPDIGLITALAFIIGSIVGLSLILRGTKSMKSAVPFGPFLALASLVVFFFGADIVRAYFGLFPLG